MDFFLVLLICCRVLMILLLSSCRVEYKYLCCFVAFFFAILLIIYTLYAQRVDRTDGIRIASCFVGGALLSGSAGWGGMAVATQANVRTAAAAMSGGLNAALRVAFTGGAVMGFLVCGLGLTGLSLAFYLMTIGRQSIDGNERIDSQAKLAVESLAGFGFGASSIALFARVAGGIYTKAADVGADLVGKVEADLPEDDPRNPAVIADNVGDNVGDVAGMGADLFESYVGAMIATATLAEFDATYVALPLWISGVGAVASFVGYFMVHTKGSTQKELMYALHLGTWTAAALQLIFSAVIIGVFFGFSDDDQLPQYGYKVGWELYACITIGLCAGLMIAELTEYFTSYSCAPTQSITAAGVTGPATVIIQGLGIGMISCFPIMFVLVATIMGCNALSGNYGVSLAAVGMLSTLAICLATDAYGPVADNAGGIAEMADLPSSVRETTDALDALGNTTAATGKGFAIGSAVLTALSLLNAFVSVVGIEHVDVFDPLVLAGIVFGSSLPFLFAALTMLSVQKAAGAIILEVRRQFKEIVGLREGKEGVEADSDACVAIATKSSVEEMILPGTYAICAPLIVGFLVGPRCLVGMLGGSIASGAALAILMANAGGAWDNAKKYVEIEKSYGGKGTAVHKAVVVGDTVGDPFKDTSGPSLNILIKLSSMIALVIGPLIEGNDDWENWYYGLIPIVLALGITSIVYIYIWSSGPTITEDMVVDQEPASSTAAKSAAAKQDVEA